MQTIRVTVSKTGKTTVEVNGIKGGTCTDATRALEEAVGQVSTREATGEACEPAVEDTVRVGG